MKFASSKLPLASAALGVLLIAVSFVWGVVVPKPNIGIEEIRDRFGPQVRGHAATTATSDEVSATYPGEPAEAAEDEPALSDEIDLGDSELKAQRIAAEKRLERAMFWRETAPMLVRYVGAALAAVGCILFPIQLLIRQEEEDQEEEDAATVVD